MNATEADLAAIEHTALDYIEGFYAGDASRVERALHPELAKRIAHADAAVGAQPARGDERADPGQPHGRPAPAVALRRRSARAT